MPHEPIRLDRRRRYQFKKWQVLCATRAKLTPHGTRLATEVQEKSLLSGIETVLRCGLKKTTQRCASPMRPGRVAPLRRMRWLCSIDRLKASSAKGAITTLRSSRSSSLPKMGTRKRESGGGRSQMWRWPRIVLLQPSAPSNSRVRSHPCAAPSRRSTRRDSNRS